MKKAIYFILFLALYSCTNRDIKNVDKTLSTIEPGIFNHITESFHQVDKLLKSDDGKFWNHPLNGPILVVDPDTRIFVANRNSFSGDFEKVKGFFRDTLPREINLANTAFDWGEQRWTMLVSPLPEDPATRAHLIIHELFHRVQPELGFNLIQEISNNHLDTYEGRVLMKMELEALHKALNAESKESVLKHIGNALFFRISRQKNESVKLAENALEINEGLAEYTGLMLSGRKAREIKLHLLDRKQWFYTNPTFVRSFAYQTIPVYGYLLYQSNSSWHREISMDSNLTDYFVEAFAVSIPNVPGYEQIASKYPNDYKNILEYEKKREGERLVRIEGYKNKFVHSPTLELFFEQMNISFDPGNLTPLEDYGTVYPNLRVTDNWGILTVEKGALLKSDWSGVVVSVPTKMTDKVIEGDGWILELSDGWRVESADGVFRLSKE